MPAFKATDLDPFTYDLKPYVDVKGTVPEPSTEQVSAFTTGLARIMRKTLEADEPDVDWDSPLEVARLYRKMTDEQNQRMYAEQLELHAAICNGHPTADDLAALPYRVRQAFYGALQGWLHPEAD